MSNTNNEERLQKALARAGVASRRACEELIAAGRVRVNGKIVTELGTKIDPAKDKVLVDEHPIAVKPSDTPRKIYIALNKPEGYLSTVTDPQGRPTIMDLINIDERLYPVGRLDADTTGLLLITNDGAFANALSHPRFGVEKEYLALIDGRPPLRELERLRKGVNIPVENPETGEMEDQMTKPAKVELVGYEGSNTMVRFVIKEGKKRQIRLMIRAINCQVLELKRVRFGPLPLGDLEEGHTRSLSKMEIKALLQAANGERATKIGPGRAGPRSIVRAQPPTTGKGRPKSDERPAAKELGRSYGPADRRSDSAERPPRKEDSRRPAANGARNNTGERFARPESKADPRPPQQRSEPERERRPSSRFGSRQPQERNEPEKRPNPRTGSGPRQQGRPEGRPEFKSGQRPPQTRNEAERRPDPRTGPRPTQARTETEKRFEPKNGPRPPLPGRPEGRPDPRPGQRPPQQRRPKPRFDSRPPQQRSEPTRRPDPRTGPRPPQQGRPEGRPDPRPGQRPAGPRDGSGQATDQRSGRPAPKSGPFRNKPER